MADDIQLLRDRIVEELGGFPDLKDGPYGPVIPCFDWLVRRLKLRCGIVLSFILHEWMLATAVDDNVMDIALVEARFWKERPDKTLDRLARLGFISWEGDYDHIVVQTKAVLALFNERNPNG